MKLKHFLNYVNGYKKMRVIDFAGSTLAEGDSSELCYNEVAEKEVYLITPKEGLFIVTVKSR